MVKLEAVRHQINALDDQLMALLSERFALMTSVSAAKAHAGLPLTDPAREALILKKTEHFSFASSIKNVYQSIFDEAKTLQKGRPL